MNQIFGFSKAQKKSLIFLALIALLVGTFHFVNDYYARPKAKAIAWNVEYLDEYSPLLQIDINHAPADSLELVPGLGPVLSQRIIAYRDRIGRILEIDSLINVEGIGNKKLEQIRPYLKVTKL